MSDKSSDRGTMNIVFETQTNLRRLAEPVPAGDCIKAAIGRAARRAGLDYGRTRELWYGNARQIKAEEIRAIEDAHRQRAKGTARELYEIARELETIADRAARVDTEFCGPYVNALRNAAHRTRSLVS